MDNKAKKLRVYTAEEPLTDMQDAAKVLKKIELIANLTSYIIRLGPPTCLIITHSDSLEKFNKVFVFNLLSLIILSLVTWRLGTIIKNSLFDNYINAANYKYNLALNQLRKYESRITWD